MKISIVIIFFLILTLVLCFACTDSTHDEDAWEKAVNQNTSAGYKEYIEEYPDGRHAFLFSLGKVANGEGITDSAPYSPDQPGPHQIVLLDASGKYHLLNKMIPADWHPSSIGDVELVAVIVADGWVTVDSRKYFDKNKGLDVSIESKQHEMDIEIREAMTGILLDTENFKGSYPQAPMTKTDTTENMGYRVDPESIKTYISKWVAADMDAGSSGPDPEGDWKKFSGSNFELHLPCIWDGGSREQFESLINKLKQKKETKLVGAVEAFPPDLLFWAYSREGDILAQVDIYKESQVDLKLDDFMESHYKEKAQKYEQVGWGFDILELNNISSAEFEKAVRTTILRTSPGKNIITEYLLKDGADVWILTFSIDSEDIGRYITVFDQAVETFEVKK